MPNMVVFKRSSKQAPATATQPPQRLRESTLNRATKTPTQTQTSTNKAVPTAVRFSDIAAGRDARENSTPIEKLINTFELCEQVLDYLSMKEVLLATRVCRAFKTNIENSSRLQAKLFLAPDLTVKKKAVSINGTLLSGVKAEKYIAAIEAAEDGQSREIALYVPHPELKLAYVSERYRNRGMVKYAAVCVETRHGQNDAGATFRDSRTVFTLPEISSLQRMLLCQPPVNQVTASYTASTGPRSSVGRQLTVCNEAGVTFGDVVTALRNAPGLTTDLAPDSLFPMSFKGGFLVNSKARIAAERSAELSSEDDPTRFRRVGDTAIFEPVVADGFTFTAPM